MSKKTYILAIVSFLLIPAAAVVGAFVFDAINPEIAAGHPDYVRNYRLLDLAKKLSLLAALLVIAGLWFLTCFFLVKSKNRSYGWLSLAVFGPLGLIVLTMLSDKLPDSAPIASGPCAVAASGTRLRLHEPETSFQLAGLPGIVLPTGRG